MIMAAAAPYPSIPVVTSCAMPRNPAMLTVVLLFLSLFAVAELVPLEKYGDLYRENIYEEQNDSWRVTPEDDNEWRKTPAADAGTAKGTSTAPKVRFGYDPAEEHIRNMQRLEQNRSLIREPLPNQVFQIGF
jgi:hypothetical protein